MAPDFIRTLMRKLREIEDEATQALQQAEPDMTRTSLRHIRALAGYVRTRLASSEEAEAKGGTK